MDRASDGKKIIYETEFNKLCYFAYKNLEEEGYADEVMLPMRWYQFGMEFWGQPEAYGVIYQDDERGTRVTRQTLSESVFDVGQELQDAIFKVARQLAGKYKNTYGTDKIVDDSYEDYAPTEFVREYHDFRSVFEDLEEGQSSLASFANDESPDDHISTVRPHMERLVESYPRSQYDEAYTLFRQWDSVTRQLAKNGDLDAMEALASDFWEMFSRVELRIHHQIDIPSEDQADWILERPRHKGAFEETLKEYRQIALKGRENTDQLDRISASYSEAVRSIANESG
jgi:hypothetical protein